MSNEEKITFGFQKLDVYRKAIDFITNVYEITKQYPKDEIYNLISQFKRASSSVALNIAEGSGRYNAKEKTQFYKISRASIYECIAILDISLKLQFIKKGEYENLTEQCVIISKMLNGLIKSTQK